MSKGIVTISIHSTARVETHMAFYMLLSGSISIHSTARVETTTPQRKVAEHIDFNPLHREGGDGR